MLSRKIEEAGTNFWLGLGDTSEIATVNPLLAKSQLELDNPFLHVLGLMRKPEYFGFTAKHLFDIELFPYQMAVLWELWHHPFPMFIGARGSGKTSLLAIYSMLRAIFNQGCKVCVVGAAFRQSKFLFEYCESIWNNSPILRDIFSDSSKNGPKKDIDRCVFRLGESQIVVLPLGDGSKIRGQRANYVICDEVASVPIEIYENVVAGFASVSSDPVSKVKTLAKIEYLKSIGMWSMDDEIEHMVKMQSNQSIISGTAYYSFNHFYDYWKRWKAIIESKGDRTKLEEIFRGAVPDGFSHRDYCIIRLPWDVIPKGMMDNKIISKQKATINSSQFLMEYGACVGPDTLIVTDRGVKKIVEVKKGDNVFTHKGRFRPVAGVTCRFPDSKVVSWKTTGYSWETITTVDHQFWQGSDDWQPLDQICETRVAKLVELSGQRVFDIRPYVGEYRECEGKIYPKYSKTKLSSDDVNEIRCSNLPLAELAKKFGVNDSSISYVRRCVQPKFPLPAMIDLCYEFGLIIGYYAAEGSISSQGKSVAFSLDGHVSVSLESYVRQLTDACKKVLNVQPTYFKCDNNVMRVIVSRRLFGSLIKYICPGVSHSKIVEPSILFSNEDFLRGFVVGYWNGDGHWRADKDFAIATCVNLGLLTQVKLALSYFGVGSAVYKLSRTTSVLDGKTLVCKPTFTLSVNGDNARLFKQIFYGISSEPARKRNTGCIPKVDGISYILKNKKDQSEYDGLVYNLHVEEDESYSLLNATVHNCFATDSNGFYKRSLVESCVVGKPEGSISFPSCGEVVFTTVLKGNPHLKYVFGVDPASEQDNFSIVVIELQTDHRRIVYCWTTTRSRFKAKVKRGLAEGDFYHYCARQIRFLMRHFPCLRIALDSQGGGVAVEEALQDSTKLEPGELPVWRIEDPDKPLDSDGKPGPHILEIVNFAKAEWVSQANHGMRKDFEDKILLFPQFDPLSISLAIEDDKMSGRIKVDDEGTEKLYDTLEDAVLEIEELKDELATIEMRSAGTRDRWDTPEVKQAGGKKGRLRKDRYSALLMANMAARTIQRNPVDDREMPVGVFTQHADKKKRGGPLYVGPSWFTEKVGSSQNFGAVARRR